MVKINTKSKSSVTFNTSDLYLNYVREKLIFFNKKEWKSSMDKGVAFIGLVKLSCKSNTGEIVPLSYQNARENNFNENEINLRRCDPTYCFSTHNSPVATTECNGVHNATGDLPENWEMKRNNLLDDDEYPSRDVDGDANYKNRLPDDAFSRPTVSTYTQSNSIDERGSIRSTTERQRNWKVKNVESIQFADQPLDIIVSIESLLQIENKLKKSQSEVFLSKTNVTSSHLDCIVASKTLLSKTREGFDHKDEVSRHVDDQRNSFCEGKLGDVTHRFENISEGNKRLTANTQELMKHSREKYIVKKRIDKIINDCKVLILANETELRSTAGNGCRSKNRYNLPQERSRNVEDNNLVLHYQEKDNSSNVDISPLYVKSGDLQVCKSVKHLVQVMRYNPVYSDVNDHKASIKAKNEKHCPCRSNKTKETDDDVIFLSVPVNKLQSSNITLISSESDVRVHSKKPSIFKRLYGGKKGSKKRSNKEQTENCVDDKASERTCVRNGTSTNTSQSRILQDNSCIHCFNRFNYVPFNYANSIAPPGCNQYGPCAHYREFYKPSCGSLHINHHPKQCNDYFRPVFDTGMRGCIPSRKCSKQVRSRSSLKTDQGSKCWMFKKFLKQGVHRSSQVDFECGSSRMILNYIHSDTTTVNQCSSTVSMEERQGSCHKGVPKRDTSNVSICTVKSQKSKSNDGLKVIRDYTVGGSVKRSKISEFYRKCISRKKKPHIEKVSVLACESSDSSIISDRRRYRSMSNKGIQVIRLRSVKSKKHRDGACMETPKQSSCEFSANSDCNRKRSKCIIRNVKQGATQASQGDLKLIQYNSSLHFHQPKRDCNCGALKNNHVCKSIQIETDKNLQSSKNIIPIYVSHSSSSKLKLVKRNSVGLSTRDLVTPSKALRHDTSLHILYPCKHDPVILPQCDYTNKKHKNEVECNKPPTALTVRDAETVVKTGENSQAQATPPIYTENFNNYAFRLYPDGETGYTLKRLSRKMDELGDEYTTSQRLEDKRPRKAGGCKQEIRGCKNDLGLKENFRVIGDVQARDKITDEQVKILKDVASGVDLVLEKLKQLNSIMAYN